MDRRRTEDVLFYALNCAIDDRQSLADAWGNDETEEAVREAKKDIAAFRLLKKRLFGNRKSRKEQFFEQPATVVNIFELRKFLKENPEMDVTTE
jgi:hypothetical protein